MTNKTTPTTTNDARRALFWMLFPVLLLVCSVTGWLLMVSIAVDDPGFSVEPDYYKKASNYDATLRQRAENARLGYEFEVESFVASGSEEARLVLRLRDRLGAPLVDAKVDATAMPVARAFDVQRLELDQEGEGLFATQVSRPRAGLWEIRVTARHHGRIFTAVLRPELAPAGDETGARTNGASPS